jgi:hypothetical protein
VVKNLCGLCGKILCIFAAIFPKSLIFFLQFPYTMSILVMFGQWCEKALSGISGVWSYNF